MLLEELGLEYFRQNPEIPDHWLAGHEWIHENPVSIKPLISEIVEDIVQKKHKAEIAARFHVKLVLLIKKIAVPFNCTKICFSGGVFQNEVLTYVATKILGDQYQLYFHNNLPANDENISFGQLIHYLVTKK